jgi:Cys-tRNA(Pro)/Cys-tRNA(Cys) deacylase
MHDPAHDSYAREAAEQLGVDPAQVHKTLIAVAAGQLVVAIVPSDALVDLKQLAIALGVKRAEMADPADAQRTTGYVLGGISPLGQRKRLPTVLDADG